MRSVSRVSTVTSAGSPCSPMLEHSTLTMSALMTKAAWSSPPGPNTAMSPGRTDLRPTCLLWAKMDDEFPHVPQSAPVGSTIHPLRQAIHLHHHEQSPFQGIRSVSVRGLVSS